jgi:hypothetical protein
MRLRTRLVLFGAVVMAATAIGAGVTSAAIGPITMDPKATLSPDRTQITLSGTINCFTGDIV